MTATSRTQVPTRRTLLSRLKHLDDQEGWRTFFDTYWKLIYTAGIKAGLTEEEAKDLVQETVLSVAKTMPNFKYDPQVCSFKSWLLLLTRRRISDLLRRRHARRRGAGLELRLGTTAWEEMPDPQSVPIEKAWEEDWQKNLMAAATERVKRKVKARHYQIFDLYAVKQWPATEVARLLQIHVAQVYLAAHRITRLIRQEVKRLEKTME